MMTLENKSIRIEIGEDGRSVLVTDRRRGEDWRLDPLRRIFRRLLSDGTPGPDELFPEGAASSKDGSICVEHRLPDGAILTRWNLAEDHVKVCLSVSGDAMAAVSMPGAFRPVSGKGQLLLPIYQGGLCRCGGGAWEHVRRQGGHGGFSLSMAAMISEKAALLATAEDLTDWECQFGEDGTGGYFGFRAVRCKTHGWYERELRFYPVAPDVTSVAKRYRARLKERGEFVSWDEKIARKPSLEKLFGALIAFTGYNRDDGIDYVASARRLHDCGFNNVLYYPVRMCSYSLDFLMGGDRPVWLDDEELRRLKQVPGAMPGPWGWLIEAFDDGSERMANIFRRDANGGCMDGWRIEDRQWKIVCTPCQIEEARRHLSADMKGMDWIHYDVNATSFHFDPCQSSRHALHGNRPIGKREEVEWTRELLGPETNGDRIVSSEGFSDRYAPYYDIGTTKMLPDRGNKHFIPVPLTMLVLHDSCCHDWWELHNYNSTPGNGQHSKFFGQAGSGMAVKKAAMDALYGCPPNVFPFGRQYGWADWDSRRSFSYSVRIEDGEVQRALKEALPVARLHKRIGRQEMLSFDILSDDGLLQSTVFADGTRIVSNLGECVGEAASCGRMEPDSWREIR